MREKSDRIWNKVTAFFSSADNKKRNRGVITQGKKLRFEQCEDRRMLSITVNSLADNTTIDSFTTFREAINIANNTFGPDQIVFDNSLANQTINIQLGNLVINERVTITGPSTGFVFINDASATASTAT